MNCVRTRLERGADVLVRIEVARYTDGLARTAGVERTAVVARRDRDGLDSEAFARPEDPDGDLAAVLRAPGSPRGLALLQERAQAFLPLGARPEPRRPVRDLGASGASRTRRFASRTAFGPPAGRSATTRSTAASSSAVTSWTSPIRSAVDASKRSPVRK